MATTSPPTAPSPPPLPPPPPPLPPPPPPPLPSTTNLSASSADAAPSSSSPPPPSDPKDLLGKATSNLERLRCLVAEIESSVVFSSTMLSHPDGLDGEATSNLPGGVLDAYRALAESCVPPVSSGDDDAAAMGDAPVDDDDGGGTTAAPPVVPGEEYALPGNGGGDGGQLRKAARSAALGAGLRRAAEVSETLKRSREEGAESIDDAAGWAAESADDAAGGGGGGGLTEEFYRRLKEVREYHARHDASSLLLPNASSSSSLPLDESELVAQERQRQRRQIASGKGSSGKKWRLGDPIADGYDLRSVVLSETAKVRDGSTFSAEEAFGKYLDLLSLHAEAAGMKHAFGGGGGDNVGGGEEKKEDDGRKRILYSDFLSALSSGLARSIPEVRKLRDRRKYGRFLSNLRSYLVGFLRRTSPLLDVERDVTDPASREFDRVWAETGGGEGWERKPGEAGMAARSVSASSATAKAEEEGAAAGASGAGTGIDLSRYSSADELASDVDGDVLKSELSRLGLKCGGTPSDRAARLFLTKGKSLDELPKKLFAKTKRQPPRPGGGGGATGTAAPTIATAPATAAADRRVDLARLEAEVSALLDHLRPILDDTVRRADRRPTQTPNERDREVYEEMYGAPSTTTSSSKRPGEEGKDGPNEGDGDSGVGGDSDEEDDDAPIYNPKGVPLGWDGKPIPYWLFKLHGLNHFYPCEICGNESYRGRRNFEKHFTESKHSFGMRCLGIPNTRHFHGVTKIEDAVELWKTLRAKVGGDVFDGEKEEEYEDSHGNVLTRDAYEDLARQGLL